MNPDLKIKELLDHLSKACGSSLSLNDGVCALYMGDQERAATLEFPVGSSYVFIHRAIGDQKRVDKATCELLLRMNFEANAMRGCWVAMDTYNILRLCTQLDPLSISGHQFIAMLTGFISLGQDLEAVLKQRA
jgi:hypothetical protein